MLLFKFSNKKTGTDVCISNKVRERSLDLLDGGQDHRGLRADLRKLNKELTRRGAPEFWITPEFLQVLREYAPIEDPAAERTYFKYWKDVVLGESRNAERVLR